MYMRVTILDINCHISCCRVESVHLVTRGSNANTIISCSKDKLIKYWNINRYY